MQISRPNRFKGVLFALTAVIISSARSQQISAPVTPLVPSVTITGTASAYDPRRDDTAAKIVVMSEELAKYGDTSVADALKRVPGVSVVSTGRGADIRMRGLGNGYTQILVNGERAPIGFSVDSLSPSQVERIEVIRSATAEFSTESVAGTINIVLRKVTRTTQRQAQLGYGGTATERTPRATLLLSDRHGNFSYALSANARITWYNQNTAITNVERSPSGVPGSELDTNSHEVARFAFFNVIPRLSWKLANGDTVTSESVVSYTGGHYTADQATERLLGPATPYPDLFWMIRLHNAAIKSDLDWETRPAPDTKLDVKFGVQAASGANDSTRLLHDGATASSFDAQQVDTIDKSYTSSGKLFRRVAEAHQLTGGWEGSRLQRADNETELNGAGAALLRVPSRLSGNVLRTAAFAQDEWTVGANWSLYLGTRVERISTNVQADWQSHVSAVVWSPIAQTLIKLPSHPNDQFRAALTRTFKAPDFTSLMPRRRRYEINSSTNPDLDGNPLLRPEIASGVDLTYEHYFSKSALVSAGVSTRTIHDYTGLDVGQDTDGRWVARPVNIGDARTRGLELEAKLPLTLLMPNGPALDMRTSLSRNWSSVAQVTGPGNRIAEQIPLQASLSADYSLDAVTLGGSFIFRESAWTAVSATQSRFSGSRRDLDLYALWKMDKQRQLRITVANLLARDDSRASQFHDLAGSSIRTTLTPGKVAVRALLEAKF
jgi:outer membrane receptor protein involved in Fe transport